MLVMVLMVVALLVMAVVCSDVCDGERGMVAVWMRELAVRTVV